MQRSPGPLQGKNWRIQTYLSNRRVAGPCLEARHQGRCLLDARSRIWRSSCGNCCATESLTFRLRPTTEPHSTHRTTAPAHEKTIASLHGDARRAGSAGRPHARGRAWAQGERGVQESIHECKQCDKSMRELGRF